MLYMFTVGLGLGRQRVQCVARHERLLEANACPLLRHYLSNTANWSCCVVCFCCLCNDWLLIIDQWCFRGKILHTRNRHLRNHSGFSAVFSNGFSVTLSNGISLFSGMFKGLTLFQWIVTDICQWMFSGIFQYNVTSVTSRVNILGLPMNCHLFFLGFSMWIYFPMEFHVFLSNGISFICCPDPWSQSCPIISIARPFVINYNNFNKGPWSHLQDLIDLQTVCKCNTTNMQ